MRFWDPHYYSTYPDEPGQPRGYMPVQQEVTRAPVQPMPRIVATGGLSRDSMTDARPARWPGDVHTFAKRFSEGLAMPGGAEHCGMPFN